MVKKATSVEAKTEKEAPASGNLIGQGNRQLKGMRDICEYVGFSESTILSWIRQDAFPATKTSAGAGIWVATTKKIDQWREVFFKI